MHCYIFDIHHLVQINCEINRQSSNIFNEETVIETSQLNIIFLDISRKLNYIALKIYRKSIIKAF